MLQAQRLATFTATLLFPGTGSPISTQDETFDPEARLAEQGDEPLELTYFGTAVWRISDDIFQVMYAFAVMSL